VKAGDVIDIPHEGERWEIERIATAEDPPFVVLVVLQPGKGPPGHEHAFEHEDMEVVEGSLLLKLPSGPITLAAGERLRVERGTPHSFRAGPDGVKVRCSYDGHHFQGGVAQLAPGDKAGFVRMILHGRRTGWAGSRLTNPLLGAVLHIIGGVGWLLGIRPRGD
jgi:quercetin dioxygenase-like cupin family protein